MAQQVGPLISVMVESRQFKNTTAVAETSLQIVSQYCGCLRINLSSKCLVSTNELIREYLPSVL